MDKFLKKSNDGCGSVHVARLPESDQRELFRNTADKMGLNEQVIYN